MVWQYWACLTYMLEGNSAEWEVKLQRWGKDPAGGSPLFADRFHQVWAEALCADKAELDAAVLLVREAHNE